MTHLGSIQKSPVCRPRITTYELRKGKYDAKTKIRLIDALVCSHIWLSKPSKVVSTRSANELVEDARNCANESENGRNRKTDTQASRSNDYPKAMAQE
jgi:hypothetical protein